MQKTCVKCGTNFEITKNDLEFYNKISPVFNEKKYQIPPPVNCPHCRMQKRLTHINERHLYRRKSNKTDKEMISTISPDKPYIVYEPNIWWSDEWDSMDYGFNYDPNKSFFEQLNQLILKVPIVSLVVDGNENCEYVQYSGWDKNCYLAFCTDYCEDCMYTSNVYYSHDSVDCMLCYSCELLYECIYCKDCYNLVYSQNCTSCSGSAFLFDCLNCKNCFGCVGLRNKQFCLFNEQLDKESYTKTIKKYNLKLFSTKEIVLKLRQPLLDIHPRKAFIGLNNHDVSGDYLVNCKNCVNCFDCTDLEDSNYCNSVRGGIIVMMFLIGDILPSFVMNVWELGKGL